MNASSNAMAAGDTMICACENLTRNGMHAALAGDPGMDFDTLLQETGAGRTCTACLLDLEYEFVAFDRGASANPKHHSHKTARKADRPARSWKRRLYDMLDALSPRTRMPLVEVLPVIAGGGFTQSLIVANHSLLYAGTLSAPPMRITLTLRDEGGHERFQETRTVAAGKTWRRELSSMLEADANGPLRIGSVTIVRAASHAGFRGTTRPQTELIGPGGAAAVHSQAARWNGGGEIVFDARPQGRRFLSFVNVEAQPLHLALRYPLPLGAQADTGSPRTTVALPAYGAALVEIEAGSDDLAQADPAIGTPLCRVSWRGTGCYKAHAFNADSALSRLSIDHL